MVFQFVERLVFGPEFSEVVRSRECVEVCEYRVSFNLSRVFHTQMAGVGIHALHFLLHVLCGVREIDAVAKALAHLRLAVGSRQSAAYLVGGQHDFWFYEHVTVYIVEAFHNLSCLLQHRLLVLSGRHCGSFECRDVGSL